MKGGAFGWLWEAQPALLHRPGQADVPAIFEPRPQYLGATKRAAAGPLTVLPAHGPVPEPLDVVARDYRHHREGRLEQIRAALGALPETEAATITPEDLAPRIYPGLTGTVARVAVQTVAAHLRHLRED